MGDRRFVYIAGYLKQTVTDSQVIGWLEQYEKIGIVFDLVLITGIKPYFKNKAARRKKISEAKAKLSGKIYDAVSVKPASSLFQLIVFVVLLALLMGDFLRGATVVIQTRTVSASRSLRWLKGLYPKLRVVYDARGATAEEYANRYQREGSVLPAEAENTYLVKLNQELSFLSVCDKVFCVSHRLKDYFLAKQNFDVDKFEVVPCCADEEIFFANGAARDETRRLLGIAGDRIVLLYSGGLDQSWQIPEFVFEVIAKLQEKNDLVFFLCLTPHQDVVEEYVAKFGIHKGNYWSGYIKYEEINAYLNAADAGLLFREDNPTNNVASPTKFAEYMMAGLPVVISKGVGDLTQFVAENECAGLVVDNDSETLVDDIASYLQRVTPDRDITSAIGRRKFSKTSQVTAIANVYEEII